MRYYPLYINLKDRSCIVVGAGEVAERKVHSLIDAGAMVTVISPNASKGILGIPAKDHLKVLSREYRNGDLEGAFLVYAATNDESVNQAVMEEARDRGVLVNVVDDPDRCDFIVPSTVSRGRLSIAISTGGASPAFARKMRMEIEGMYGEEYAVFLDIMADIRRKLLTKGLGSGKNRRIFNSLIDLSIPRMIKEGRWDEVDDAITSLLGKEFSLTSLDIKKG